jgi:hypothetical protein
MLTGTVKVLLIFSEAVYTFFLMSALKAVIGFYLDITIGVSESISLFYSSIIAGL